MVMAVMNLPIGEDPTQRAGDGRGDEEVADPQGVFALCVEEGEVDGLLVGCQHRRRISAPIDTRW
jgi:hypothetical protein